MLRGELPQRDVVRDWLTTLPYRPPKQTALNRADDGSGTADNVAAIGTDPPREKRFAWIRRVVVYHVLDDHLRPGLHVERHGDRCA